jgi:hypothetical protein
MHHPNRGNDHFFNPVQSNMSTGIGLVYQCRGDLVCVTAGSALGYGGAQANWQFCVSPEF